MRRRLEIAARTVAAGAWIGLTVIIGFPHLILIIGWAFR